MRPPAGRADASYPASMEGTSALRRRLRALRSPASPPARPAPREPAPPKPDPRLLCWALDHFYSPVPDSRALAQEPDRSRVWPAAPPERPGIDWRADEQTALLAELGAQPRLA